MKHLTILILVFLLSACYAKEASFAPESVSTYSENEMVELESDADYAEFSPKGQQGISYQLSDEASPPRSAQAPQPPTTTLSTPQRHRLLIQHAEMHMEVDDLDSKVQHLEQLLRFRGGYLANMTWENHGYQHSAQLDIRVPARHFQRVLDTLRQMAVRVNQQRVHTQDATEEYVDIQGRLATKKQVRDRYQDILRLKAKTVEEVLLAEEKIRVLQEEIESREGRMRYLSERAAVSTISLSMYEPVTPTVAETDTPWYADVLKKIGNSLLSGWYMVADVLWLLLEIWPVALLVAWLVWRRKYFGAWWKRRKVKEVSN